MRLVVVVGLEALLLPVLNQSPVGFLPVPRPAPVQRTQFALDRHVPSD